MTVNLYRDSVWCTSDHFTKWSTPTNRRDELLMNADPQVYDDIASVCAVDDTSLKKGQRSAVGVYVRPPASDRTPYKIKAHANGPAYIFIGSGPKGPEGNDDVVEKLVILPLAYVFDEVVMLPPGDESHPTAVGIFTLTSGVNVVHLSVQRLATLPPTFDSRVT